jgi:MFS family permease
MRNIKPVVFASIVLSGLTTAVILPIVAPLVRSLSLSVQQGGWMLSISSISMAALAGPWGLARDRWGRRRVLLIGFAGMFFSYALFTAIVWQGLSGLLAGTWLLFLITGARALLMAFLPAVPAAAQALMADHTAASERAGGMALIGAGSGVGMVLGPALGGLLATRGIAWPLVFAGALCLLAFFVVWATVPRSTSLPAARKLPSVDPLASGLWPWLAASLMSWIAIVTIQVIAGFYFQDRLGLETTRVGPQLAAALTVTGVALFGTQLLQARLLGWSARRMIVAGAAFWVAGLVVLLGIATMGAYVAAFAALGAGAGFLMAGSMAGASLAVSADRQGTVAGLIAAMQGVALVVTPIVSTALYGVDRMLPFACLAVLMCCLGVLFALPSLTMTRRDWH